VRTEREPADDENAEDEGDAQPGSDHPSDDGPHHAIGASAVAIVVPGSQLWQRDVEVLQQL
jgi:hypothetical protein